MYNKYNTGIYICPYSVNKISMHANKDNMPKACAPLKEREKLRKKHEREK